MKDGTTTPDPQPTEPTKPGGNSSTAEKELVGTWAGYYQGFSYYYKFKADGTFSLIMQYQNNSKEVYNLIHGKWNITDGKLNMTQRKRTEWDYEPPATLKWENVGDVSMRIEIHGSDGHYSERHFVDLDTEGFDCTERSALPDYIDEYFTLK